MRLTRSNRQTAVAFLQTAGLYTELEHLFAVEERLSANTRPALHHAALSTRLLLEGVADRLFPAKEQPFKDRFGGWHEVGKTNVGNRLAAFVDLWLRSSISDEEHRLFIATLDTVNRWCGRGPHRIYSQTEPQRLFIRLLDVLVYVSFAYSLSAAPPPAATA